MFREFYGAVIGLKEPITLKFTGHKQKYSFIDQSQRRISS
jgi:hypothetical protein